MRRTPEQTLVVKHAETRKLFERLMSEAEQGKGPSWTDSNILRDMIDNLAVRCRTIQWKRRSAATRAAKENR